MPHCRLNKAATLLLLKPRCEVPTLLYIRCLYLKNVFVLMPRENLAAIFIPKPPDLWLGCLWEYLISLFPCGLWLGQAPIWAQGSVVLVCFFSLALPGAWDFLWATTSTWSLRHQLCKGTVLEYVWPGKWGLPSCGVNSCSVMPFFP